MEERERLEIISGPRGESGAVIDDLDVDDRVRIREADSSRRSRRLQRAERCLAEKLLLVPRVETVRRAARVDA
jgi:hypothetical protein